MPHRHIAIWAALLAALAVGLGALGAHALKPFLGTSLEAWKTAVFYHLTHAIALWGLWLAYQRFQITAFKRAAYCIIAGVICFSGSLYLLTTLPKLGMQIGMIVGPITPIGGVLMMIGWLYAAYGVTKIQYENPNE